MSFYIGIIGNTYSQIPEEKIKKKLDFLFNKAVMKKFKYEDKDFDDQIYIVSGLVCLGVPKIAIEIANIENFPVIGIGPKVSKEYFKKTCLNHKFKKSIYFGEKYGDEDEYFIKNIDILICLDGSEHDYKKITLAKKKNIPIIVYCK